MRSSISDIDAREQIRARARGLGFDAVGFAHAQAPDSAAAGLSEFLSHEHHGDMVWMATTQERRADPRALWPEAKSVIALGVNYAPSADPLANLSRRERGVISCYALGDDYHDVFRKRLKALAGWIAQEFLADVRIFVDTAPVMEKPLAQAAGIGWQGKHTNLVSREFGSWLFLGSIFTTLEISPDEAESDHCGSCQRCLDICPTRAFPAPYQIDARRCISYLTIEHKGPIPEEFRAAIGNRIYGCDDCLAVCPWNKFAQASQEAAFVPRAALTSPLLRELATLDDAEFRQVFRGSAIKRIGRNRFVRNVLIAIGNSSDTELVPTAERLISDASPLVRASAVWALKQLLPKPAFRALASKHAKDEADVDVLREWHLPDQ
jgi:epoxyqueuosine reductase